MTTTKLIDLADEILDQIINHSHALESITPHFVPIDGSTNLFITLPRKSGLVSLSSTCARLRRISIPTLFHEVYLSRNCEKDELASVWEARKASTPPTLLNYITRFDVYTQCYKDEVLASTIVDMINTFSCLCSFAFKSITVFSAATQLAITQAINRHPSLKVACLPLRLDEALSDSIEDLTRLRIANVPASSLQHVQPLLRAGLQIDCLSVHDLSSLKDWLRYSSEVKIYGLYFHEIDDPGRDIEKLVSKYMDTLETITLQGDKSIRDSSHWLRISALQLLDDDVMILSLRGHKSFDKTFSTFSDLTVFSPHPQQHILSSGGSFRFCKSLHSSFPDLEALTIKFFVNALQTQSNEFMDVIPERVKTAYDMFRALHLLIISVKYEGSVLGVMPVKDSEPITRYIDARGDDISVVMCMPRPGEVHSLARRCEPAGLRYFNMAR